MSIVYSWNIKKLKTTVATSNQGTELSGVVDVIEFEREGHDEETGRNYVAGGKINLVVDNLNDSQFTAYSDLTPDKITEWIVSNIDSDDLAQLEARVKNDVDVSKAIEARYAEMAEYSQLPWDVSGPADEE